MGTCRKPIAIDFFCGAGGMSLGFKQAGFDVVGAIDNDPIHIATHQVNFPDTKHLCADVTSLSAADIRLQFGLTATQVVDAVFRRPPCQGFSTIGKRNHKDMRNELLIEFCHCIAELRPRYFVLENVPGLLLGNSRASTRTCFVAISDWQGIAGLVPLDAQCPKLRRATTAQKGIHFRVPGRGNQPHIPEPRKDAGVTVRDAIRDLYVLVRRKPMHDGENFSGKVGEPSTYARANCDSSAKQPR